LASAISRLSTPAIAQGPPPAQQSELIPEPPAPAEIRRFFREADVVAVGRVSDLRIAQSGGLCCHVSYQFTIERFLKGEDVSRFAESFEPRGAREETLRKYYDGELVFFYRKSGRAGAVKRESIWVASAALGVEEFLKGSPK